MDGANDPQTNPIQPTRQPVMHTLRDP